MFNAIFVDDEPLATPLFKKCISHEERIRLLQAFVSPADALAYIKNYTEGKNKDSIDIVFTDIEMPEMTGISFAEQVQELLPAVEIVFITAYEQYALQAFQLYATGYLLKPVQLKDIQNLLDSIDKKRGTLLQSINDTTEKKLTVSCFGRVSIPLKLRTEKAAELLILLIQQNGAEISRRDICEILWPDFDSRKAENNFYVTISYLKKTLFEEGYKEVIERRSEFYSIPVSHISCDYYDFMQFENAAVAADTAGLEKVTQLYKTGFCADKSWEFLDEIKTECCRSYVKMMYQLAALYAAQNNTAKTEETLKSILAADLFEEKAFTMLKRIYIENHNMAACRSLEQSYKEKLNAAY